LIDIQVHESKAMVIYAIMYGDCISFHRNSFSTTIYWGRHGEDAMICQDYEGTQGVNFKNVLSDKETWLEEGSTLHNFNQDFVDNDLINQVPMALREVSRLNNMY